MFSEARKSALLSRSARAAGNFHARAGVARARAGERDGARHFARRERIAARKARRDAERVALGLVDDEDARAANGVGDAVERDDADVDAAYASGVTVTVRAGIGASDDGF